MGDSQAPKNAPDASLQLNNLGKRQLVNKANTMIFVWVTASSVILVICIIVAVFLVRQGLFNNQIIGKLANTDKTVTQNIDSAKQLIKNMEALIADDNLPKVKAKPDETNFEVVFDALPTTGDTTTISNSIFTHILTRSSVSTNSLSVGAESGVPQEAPTSAPMEGSPTPQAVNFSIDVSGNTASAKQMLVNFEHVIKPMSLTTLNILASSNSDLTIKANGVTYYLAADSVKLGKEMVRPKL